MRPGDTRCITHLLRRVAASALLYGLSLSLSFVIPGCTVERQDAACEAEAGDDMQEAGAARPVRVATGGAHTCVLLDNGTTHCWGLNLQGQLGTGNTSDEVDTPQPVPRLRGVTQVALGGNSDQGHTCALLRGGTMRCWGAGSAAQLGDGGSANQPAPVCVNELSDIEEIGAGFAHTCARRSTGDVWCWGFNLGGQLGGGTMDTIVPTFVRVGGDQRGGFARIVLGGGFTCGLTRNQQMYCWGDNRRGQLGCGQDNQTITSPVQVVGFPASDPPVQIAAGYEHVCARLKSNSIMCWGNNQNGQLGTGTLTDASTPQPVKGLTGVEWIAAGGWNTCALKDGNVWCWGRSDWSEGGIPTAECGGEQNKQNPTPRQIAGVEHASDLAVGGFHSCALQKGGSVICWGRHTHGQLGIGPGEKCYGSGQRTWVR